VSVDPVRGQAGAQRDVTKGSPGRAAGAVVGATLFLQTTKGAPNGRVVVADVTHPEESRWRTVIPERLDAIEDVAFGRGVIAVTYLKQASSVTEVFDYSGRSIGVLAQPGIGRTAIASAVDRTDAFLLFESFNRPPTIFRVDLLTPSVAPSQWKAPAAPVDPDSVSVEIVRYPAKDGTGISMFLAKRKDVALNGALPTLLSGYGAFGVSMRPAFAAHWFQWFQAGGMLAIPHVRGGGEYGEAWHMAGARDRKTTSIDDFIAAADWLVANKYTNPDKLAILGGAAGGLLDASAMVSRPDLFRAVVLVGPLLDMFRYDLFPPAAAWTPEFGSAADAGAFASLRLYTPYQRVSRGTRYPGVMLSGGDDSGPVHPMHVRKMAARLQAATTSDPAERPVLLSIEKPDDTIAPQTRALQALVDQRVFLMWQLGVK
jgi:prolyl oligopeptidase